MTKSLFLGSPRQFFGIKVQPLVIIFVDYLVNSSVVIKLAAVCFQIYQRELYSIPVTYSSRYFGFSYMRVLVMFVLARR